MKEEENLIVINEEKHYSIKNKEKEDTCHLCSLKEMCNALKSVESKICEIFGLNSHFEKK